MIPGSWRIEMQTSPFFSMLGCQISLITFIFGGLCGYSFGNIKWHLKKPPSNRVSAGPIISIWKITTNQLKTSYEYITLSMINIKECLCYPIELTSHLKKSLSLMSPAENPSTGFLFKSANCFLRSCLPSSASLMCDLWPSFAIISL